MSTTASVEPLLSNPAQDVPRSKAFLAKLTSPLAKRKNKFFDFDIEPENVYRTYGPGDSVKGSIVLTVWKGFEITHLTVALHGTAIVYKHDCTPGESHPIPDVLLNRQGNHGFEYHGNGMASMFQDEQTLCGSGFLRKQVYKFGFELQFPTTSLPTTLRFERGSIGYMVRATVTRPTTIAPSFTKTCSINYQDRIDIASMYTPKSRAMTMEPLSRRGKQRKQKWSSDNPASPRPNLSRQPTANSLPSRASTGLENPPLSPTPSDITTDTAATQSTHSLQMPPQSVLSGTTGQKTSERRTSDTSGSGQVISTTVELSRHGALPGDTIPIRVQISHTKPVRGIIVATVYRTGAVDSYPALVVTARGKQNKAEYEDVYAKSKTGLGGLYFTSSTPNMVFRKDLTQTSTMMAVDPKTLDADVRFSVRVPTDAFPSITNIPKQMIHFEYHVEVIIDLHGKMNESSILPSLTSSGPSFTASAEMGNNNLTQEWANSILDTTPYRRSKTVAKFNLPLTVGTMDSRRARQRLLEKSRADAYEQSWPTEKRGTYPQQYEQWEGYSGWEDQQNQYGEYQENHPDYYQHAQYQDEYSQQAYLDHDSWHANHQSYASGHQTNFVPQFLPPVDTDLDEPLDEKARLRRQAELLLPSQPPIDDAPVQAYVPSAPPIDGLTYRTSPAQHSGSSRHSIPTTTSRASARSADTVVPEPPITPPASIHGADEQHERAEAAEGTNGVSGSSDGSVPVAGRGTSAVLPQPDTNEYNANTLRQDGDDLPRYHK